MNRQLNARSTLLFRWDTLEFLALGEVLHKERVRRQGGRSFGGSVSDQAPILRSRLRLVPNYLFSSWPYNIMPRPSNFITAFHQRFSGLRKIRIPSKFDFVTGFVFTLYFWSFIVFNFLPAATSDVDRSELPAGWLSWKYPSPRSNPDECGWTDVVTWARDLTRNISWICDPDHILGYNEGNYYTCDCITIHINTSACCPYMLWGGDVSGCGCVCVGVCVCVCVGVCEGGGR